MTRKTTATDFFDPSIQMAKFAAQNATGLTAASVLENGGEKVAAWVFEMSPEATLESLKRFVKPEAYGKAFADGEVFRAIPDVRTAEVTMLKLEDGSGVSIAKLSDASRAMSVLLEKLPLSDLELMPKPPVPKKKKHAEKQGTLTVNGAELTVKIAEPEDDEPVVAHRQVPMRALGGQMPVNAGNPLALKAFLKEVWGAEQQSIAMHSASDLAVASIMAATSEAHPDDAEWPAGIKVSDKETGEAFESPKKAMMAFDAAIAGRKDPVMTADDVMAEFQSARSGAPRAPKA